MTEHHRRALRAGFVLYAVALFVATHKPGVQVNVVPGVRLDLLIHMAAFGVWTALLGVTGWLGNVGRVGRALLLATIGIGYAVIDESSQALPIFDRVFDPTDMVANSLGSLVASGLLFVLMRRWSSGAGDAA